MPAPFPHTFPRIPHTTAKLQKIRLQIQRDQRHDPANQAPTNPHVFSATKGGGSGNAHGAVPLGMGTATVPSQLSLTGTATRRGIPCPPRPAAGPPRSTHPTDPLKFPATTGPLKPTHPTGLTTFPAPAAGAANPQPVWSRKFPGPATGPLKCTSNQLTQIPTSNDWGAWATTPASLRRQRRRRGGGSQHVCVIGPKGPMMVRPEGRTDSRA